MEVVCCCDLMELWLMLLSFADTLTDFLYFDKLYGGDEVSEGVAFIVLTFALFGLVGMLIGPTSQIGLTMAVLLEDVPQIIATTAIEAYVVGGDIKKWTSFAIASYVFSVIALQQKFVKIGYAPSLRRTQTSEDDKPDIFWVIFCSLLAVIATLSVAWIVAGIVIAVS